MSFKLAFEKTALIESSFDVNSLEYLGLKVWPIIKFELERRQDYPKRFNSDTYSVDDGLIPIRMISEDQKALLRSFRGTELLFYSNVKCAEYAEQYKGKRLNPFLDPLIDTIKDRHSYLKLELQSPDLEDTDSLHEPAVFINPSINYAKDPVCSISNYKLLQPLIKDICGLHFDEIFFVKQARTILGYQVLFKEILSLVLPKAAFFVCYYYEVPMGLISACREMGIKSVDIQRGAICKYQIPYDGWANIPQGGYNLVPDYFWCWGRPDIRNIERLKKPGSFHVPILGGNPRMLGWLGREKGQDAKRYYDYLKSREKVILIAMGLPEDGIPEHVLEVMRNSPKNWLWLIRMHPYLPLRNKQACQQICSLLEEYGINNYEIEFSTSEHFFRLLPECHHIVTLLSSCWTEGLIFNVPATIVDPIGRECFEDSINEGVLSYADTAESLARSISKYSRSTDIVLKPQFEVSRELTKQAFKTILGPDHKELVIDSVAVSGEYFNAQTEVEDNNCISRFNECDLGIFTVETVLGCDLMCPECAIGGNLISRKKGCMSFEQFKVIADKIRPYCRYLYPHIWGEPMLNKDIFKMIEYASSFTKTNISTNGKCMTRKMTEKLILSGVTDIIVSIDGITQEVYEQYRVGGSVTKAMWVLSMLSELNKNNGNKVKISPQFIVFKHNQHQMQAFEGFCNSLGLKPSFKSPYIRSDSGYENSDLQKYIRSSYPDVESQQEAMAQNCMAPKEAFTILLDGTCTACCHDHNSETNYGNIFRQDVMEIWNSHAYRKDREAIIAGKAPNSCLKTCLNWTLDRSVCVDKSKDRIPEMV